MTTLEMEYVLLHWLRYRANIVVPNVSWGLDLHECDLLRVTPRGWATEVEIKISKADLLKDKAKSHGHRSNRIKNLFFAVPTKLHEVALQNIPERAGLLIVDDDWNVKQVKPATANASARKFTEREINKLLHLGCMRIQSLKHQLIRMRRRSKRKGAAS